MNRFDFLNMIENSVPVTRQMISEVSELIGIFPYFQSAHLLLLKGLYRNEDVKFENQLRNSAIHAGDREVLYWLLKSNTSCEDVKVEGSENITSKEEIITDTEQTVIESARNSEFMINEIEKDESEGSPDNLHIATSHQVMIATESDNTEPAGVVLLLEEETSPSDEKVFFMDPGFSIPERSDLLELDLEEDHTMNYRSEDTKTENQDEIK